MNILYAALVLGGMGILLGLLLKVVGTKFAVPSNPTRDAVREVLPGANCGGCGYPGCDGCADAIANGKAPVNACPVGGADAAAAIAAILGVEAVAGEKTIATLQCQGSAEHCGVKFEYTGVQDCVAASTLAGGNKACQFACLGLGTCTKVCPFDAIHIDPEKHLPVVDAEKCQSCGKCVDACPREVLALLPANAQVKISCHNPNRGPAVKLNCDVGCIGCTKCEKTCKFEAITMVNNLPVIDSSKCKGCLMCAKACPTGAITSPKFDREAWKIQEAEKQEKIKAALAAKAAKEAAEKAE